LISIIKNILNPGDSLKWKAMQGTFILVGTEVYTQGIRLVGNLIMTRLLYPEAFGLMLIVGLVMTALEQFSDAGVRPAVVIKSHGREEKFLSTAWVILGSRGAILTTIALLFAWPLSLIYDQETLLGLLCIASFSALIQGFESPQQMISEREVQRVRLMLLDTIPQTLAIVGGIAVMWFYPTIWVLAGMALVGPIIRTLLSYLLFPLNGLKFRADKEVFKEIFGFGKWIFLATAMTFLAAEGDKLITTGFLTVAQLGVFSIAVTFAKLVDMVSARLAHFLLMPVFVQIEKEDNKKVAEKKIRKIKVAMFGLMLPLVLLFTIFGQLIIDILYDERYQQAGWMLQVMALGGIFSMTNNGFNAFILSKGNSYQYSMLNLVRVVISTITVFCGGYFFGILGIVYAIALNPVFSYVILFGHVKQYKIDSLTLDLLLFVIPLSTIFLIWYITNWPGLISV
jgi:O-antigen/teichoic acid export membrane protein